MAVEVPVGPALVAMDAIDLPVRLLLRPPNPVADPQPVILVQGSADGILLVQDELVVQEVDFAALVRRILVAPEPEVAMEGVFFFVAQFQVGLAQGVKHILLDMVGNVVAQGVDSSAPSEVGAAGAGPRLLTEGAGGAHDRHPAIGRVHIGGGAGLVQVAAATGVGQVNLAAVFQGGQKAALGKVEGMVVGGSHRIDAHPLQFVQILGVGASIGRAAPLPAALVVMEQHLQVHQGNIGGPEYLDQLEESFFLEGLHPAGYHGIATHGNRNIAALGIVNRSHGCLLAVSGQEWVWWGHFSRFAVGWLRIVTRSGVLSQPPCPPTIVGATLVVALPHP